MKYPGKGIIKCEDCIKTLQEIPDRYIDLVIIDPPYKYDCANYFHGCGAFGLGKRDYHESYINLDKTNLQRKGMILSAGLDLRVLDILCEKLKKINIYIWSSKGQVGQLLTYFEKKGVFTDLITWHKTNPTPSCNGTYLNDTEYVIFAREKGVKVYGSYQTKRKYYVSPVNKQDKKKYKHPTIKPINIIENFIINSSKENDIVLDCYMGSGTTCCAAINQNRRFIGIEIDENYYDIAKERIEEQLKVKGV